MFILPIKMQEVLEYAPALMWMDASFRLQTRHLDPVFDLVIQNGGIAQFRHSVHTIFAATDPRMWQYLVTNHQMMKSTRMHGANSVLIYKTEKVYTRVLYWWVLCALDPECITPTGSSRRCPKEGKNWRTRRLENCHRQDQSALCTLIANLYHFQETWHVPDNSTRFVRLVKTPRVRIYNATVCELDRTAPLRHSVNI